MISLIKKQEIIISHFLEGLSQWEIFRRTGIDRKTIRKYIKEYEEKKRNILESGEGDLEAKNLLIADIVSPPRYDTSNRVRTKLTEEVTGKIDSYLRENEVKRQSGKSKQQKKNVDIHECLIEDGYDIGYQTVCKYIKEQVQKSREAYIRQEYELGDVAEFDWGTVKITIDGVPRSIQMAVFTNAKGNFRFSYLYQNQKMESFLDSHVRFFNEIGGVHKTVVYDNMKVAVAKFASKNGKEPTEDLLKLSMYYGFRYRFCNARRGNEKGHVERSVEYVRRKAFCRKDEFKSIQEANDYLQGVVLDLNQRPSKSLDNKSPKDILAEERPFLNKLMPDYDIARVSELRVSKYSVVSIDENKYSVPDNLVGKFVTTKIYPQKILIYSDGKKVAEHTRSYEHHSWNIKIEHYLGTLKKKPGAIHSSTALQQVSPRLQTIYTKYYTRNSKDFIELIDIVLRDGLEKVEDAILELENISPIGICTEKVRMLCDREPVSKLKSCKDTGIEIESQSRNILAEYSSILNGSTDTFDKGVKIV